MNNLDNQQGSLFGQCTVNENYWLGGFIEGEASFNVAFKLSSQAKLGFYPSPSFSVTQHFQGKQILELIKATFGGIGSTVAFKSGSKTVIVYTVTNLDQLVSVVIPFLIKYNALSARKVELNSFIKVCNLMKQRQHLNEQGLRNIVDIVFNTPLKKGGNRQISKEDLITVLGNNMKVLELIGTRRPSRK